MPQNEQMESYLKQLKQSYDKMPIFSNARRITNKIHQTDVRQKRFKKRRWLPVTATIATVALAGLLLVTTPGLFNGESLEDSQQNTMDFATRDGNGGADDQTVESHSNDNDIGEGFSDEEADEESAEESNADAEIAAKERPEKKTDVIEVEGTPVEETFKLIVNDELAFSTYYPEDMIAESSGNRIKLFVSFEGQKHEDAFVEFFGNEIEGDVSEAENELLSDFDDDMLTEKNDNDFWIPLSEREFILEKSDFFGTVSLFERNGIMYRITLHYPPEYGDGFGPRASKIIAEMMWYDETTIPEGSS